MHVGVIDWEGHIFQHLSVSGNLLMAWNISEVETIYLTSSEAETHLQVMKKCKINETGNVSIFWSISKNSLMDSTNVSPWAKAIQRSWANEHCCNMVLFFFFFIYLAYEIWLFFNQWVLTLFGVKGLNNYLEMLYQLTFRLQ